MNQKRGVTSSTEGTKIFLDLVCRGKIRAATRYICDREKGGVLMSDDIDEKSGEREIDVLQSKYIESRSTPLSYMPNFNTHPETLEILVTDENVETVAKLLSGSVGTDGIDSSAVSGMLLKHGELSSEL